MGPLLLLADDIGSKWLYWPWVADHTDEYEWRCYRHPGEEAGVKCRRCERPICPRCMISAPVEVEADQVPHGRPASG